MSTFQGKSVTRTARIKLNGSVSEVFPLFEPVNEKKWAHGWDPTVIFPAGGPVNPGLVFTTDHDSGPTAIWNMITHDTDARLVEYLKVQSDVNVIRVTVRCEAIEAIVTEAQVTYTMTSLTKNGDQTVDDFTDEFYSVWIDSWAEAINFYLKTGKMLVE